MNLGGGPRPTPKTALGVPIYFHDQFGPGRDAKIVSTKTRELKTDGLAYREEPLLTGDESRVAEIKGVPFPTLLNPIDDLPPTTVITYFERKEGGKLTVRGVTADNGTVKRVLVNGREAHAVLTNFAQWEIDLEDNPKSEFTIQAHAEDIAGNVETHPHSVIVHQ